MNRNKQRRRPYRRNGGSRRTIYVDRFLQDQQTFLGNAPTPPRVTEPIDWLHDDGSQLSSHDLIVGEKCVEYDDRITFYGTMPLIAALERAKNTLNACDARRLARSKTRYDAFERIASVARFTNRAAIKLANINFTAGCQLTRAPSRGDRLHYADLCAGPGGFSEFLRGAHSGRAYTVCGYGLTLRGPDDFQTRCIAPSANFHFTAIYGPAGTGDICDEATQNEFIERVMRATDGEGVSFVLADGGFDVRGQENAQELLSRQLYLCQTLVALSVLARDGRLVLKLFDVFTKFSVGLLYVLHKCFAKICILKPYTSRPANSERYVVCTGFHRRQPIVVDHLRRANARITHDTDVLELVPSRVIEDDAVFCMYVRAHLETFTEKQVRSIERLMRYYRDDDTKIYDNASALERESILSLVNTWLAC